MNGLSRNDWVFVSCSYPKIKLCFENSSCKLLSLNSATLILGMARVWPPEILVVYDLRIQLFLNQMPKYSKTVCEA